MDDGKAKCGARRGRMHGLTLIELMVAVTLSLLVGLAATSILISSKKGYLSVDEGTRVQDAGRFAIDVISRSVRQAGYENWDRNDAPVVLGPDISANIAGFDNQTTNDSQPFVQPKLASDAGANNDVLGLKYFGSGSAPSGDGTVLNCAGFSVPAPSSQAAAETERGASVFYVAKSGSGIAELRCKYYSGTNWQSDAIVSGVDSFQVLYGLDLDGNGIPERFVRAEEVNALDSQMQLAAATAAGQALERNKRTYWKKVVAVKVALLVSGAATGRVDAMTTQYALFGEKYGTDYGTTDAGTFISEADMPQSQRDRPRRLFTATIQVRNRSSG